MPEDDPQQRELSFDIKVPPDLEGGVYANFMNIWHTPHEFTFDSLRCSPLRFLTIQRRRWRSLPRW